MGVDIVIHCAARAHILSNKELDADLEYEKINVLGSKKLLESSISAGVKKFTFLSSIKAVGERTDVKEPFNPQTNIDYELPESVPVTLEIFNIAGKRVATLVNGQVSAGYHSVVWNGQDDYGRPVAGSIYLYRIKAGDFQQTMRMLYLR